MAESKGSYRDQLLDVLRTRDPQILEEFSASREKPVSVSLPRDNSLWELAMHLIVIETPELPELQEESLAWLAFHRDERAKRKRRQTPGNQAPRRHEQGQLFTPNSASSRKASRYPGYRPNNRW